MRIASTGEARERVLAYGGPGAGKTYGYFAWAKAAGTKLWVVESDPTVAEFTESDEFADVDVEWETVFRFPEYTEAIDKFSAQMGADDILAIDMGGRAWEAAQDHFTEVVFGKGGAELFLDKRREAFEADKKKTNPFDGLMDWPAIKKLYFEGFGHKLLRVPGHLYVVSAAKDIIEGMKIDRNITRTYGSIGARPEGEKTLGHMVRTVLFLQGNSPETWRMTKVKDRQREDRWGDEQTRRLKNFAMDYLVKIAGWRPVKD